MKFASKTIAFAVVLFAACLSASAQEQTIKFNLPEATQVGSVDLPAGAYRMMLIFGSGMKVVSVSGEGKDSPSVMTLPIAIDSGHACSGTSLMLKRSEGKLELASACFADDDLAIDFSPAASKKTSSASTVEKASVSGQ